jgi:hypothetical protein
MNCEQFNEKWKEHLEEGHYGMAIDDPDVISYMDDEFRMLKSINPNFTFSQIKLKFGFARVYVKNVPIKLCSVWEQQINEIINENRS